MSVFFANRKVWPRIRSVGLREWAGEHATSLPVRAQRPADRLSPARGKCSADCTHLSAVRDIPREFAAKHIDVKCTAFCQHPVCQVDPLAFTFVHLRAVTRQSPGEESLRPGMRPETSPPQPAPRTLLLSSALLMISAAAEGSPSALPRANLRASSIAREVLCQRP